jgi:putative membrane protein
LIPYEKLPALNAALNATCAILLLAGYAFIRRRKISAHRRTMKTAFAVSVVFLASYLTYHQHAGVHRYPGTGTLRTVYLVILATHTVLAVVVVPLVLRTLYLASRARLPEHRRIARWTLPIWFYVSVTGVVVYGMLYHPMAGSGPSRGSASRLAAHSSRRG